MFHWKAQGDANFYVILDGQDNWFAQVQLNGGMFTAIQEKHMDTIVDSLNSSKETTNG